MQTGGGGRPGDLPCPQQGREATEQGRDGSPLTLVSGALWPRCSQASDSCPFPALRPPQACAWPHQPSSGCSENSTCTCACPSLFAALSSSSCVPSCTTTWTKT